MGRKFGKYSKLLFKVVLLIQLYCYHSLEVNAHHNATHFEDVSEKDLQRAKRPARLIPAQYFFQEEENGTVTDKRFYGPASNCVEISKLGYTLNGYYLVKGKNQTKNDQVEVLGCRFKHPHGSREVKEERVGFIDIEITKSVKRRSQEPFEKRGLEASVENVDADRRKRPVRLLPWRRILEKSKNNTENEPETRFYGPASSCEELGKLGYTLNGLYLVDCKDKSMKGKIEVIECRFKQPQGSKQAKEERIGFVNIEVKKTKTVKRRHANALKKTKSTVKRESNRIKRPIRLLPKHILYGKEKDNIDENKVAERFYGPPRKCSELGKLGYTLNGYYLVNGTASSHHIEISLCKFQQPTTANESFKDESFVLEFNKFAKMIKVNPKDGDSYLLMNQHQKCITGKRIYDYFTFHLVQSDCNPDETGQVWKWSGGRLYNDLGYITKSFKGTTGRGGKGSPIFEIHAHKVQIKEEEWRGQQWQTWQATNKNQLVNSDGLCLSVDRNSPHALLSSGSCALHDKGQFWSFMAII